MEQPLIFNFLPHFEPLPCSCQVQHGQVLPHTLQQLHCKTDRERNQNPRGRAAMPGGREQLLLEILFLIRKKKANLMSVLALDVLSAPGSRRGLSWS